MTRVMYDSIRAAGMPAGGDLYCCYTDGIWANEAAVRAAFPGKPIVRISALGRTDADVIDVEPGCVWPPSAAAAWLAARPDATIYCGLANLASVVAALGTSHPYWVAHYTNVPHVCSQSRCGYNTAGAHIVGTQYGGDSNEGGYHFDVSAIYDDSWHNGGHSAQGGGTPIDSGADLGAALNPASLLGDDMPVLIGATDAFGQVQKGQVYYFTGFTCDYIGDPGILNALVQSHGPVKELIGADVLRHIQQADAARSSLLNGRAN